MTLFADAPELGKKALENVIAELKSQVSEPRAKVESAGRVGARLGKRSELTMIVPLAPGGAKRLRAFLQMLDGNLSGGADKVGTLHDMRFVFIDNDTRMLFATSFDGDWDVYIDDFVTKIPDFLDVIDSAWEGWPGIRSPQAKDYLVKHQITAEGWYVANPDLTVAEITRLKRIGKAVDEFLDKSQRVDQRTTSDERMRHVVREGIRRRQSFDARADARLARDPGDRPQARGRRRTSARTCSCASTMLGRAASSCGDSHLMSTPRRTGGARPIPGCPSRSATRASRRSGFLVLRWRAFPRRSASGWRHAPGSSETRASTTRRTGSGRSAREKSISD